MGWPGDQALGDPIGKVKRRKSLYMGHLEGLLSLSGVSFPRILPRFLICKMRRTVFRTLAMPISIPLLVVLLSGKQQQPTPNDKTIKYSDPEGYPST